MIKKIVIKGLVQGIGFRPYVAELAEELNIGGYVRNSGGIVTIVANVLSEEILDEFLARIKKDVPMGGRITSVVVKDCPESEVNVSTAVKDCSESEANVSTVMRDCTESKVLSVEKTEDNCENVTDLFNEFFIVKSNDDENHNLPLIPADIATCDRCQAELLDESNRRFNHAFISCTTCGPRYSILEKLPYDRDTITMKDFDMCPQCQKEYTGKGNIRRHAQTIACPECGPQIMFEQGFTAKINDDEKTIESDSLEILSPAEKAPKKVEDINSTIKEAITTINAPTTTINAPATILNTTTTIIREATTIIREGGILAVKDIGGYHLCCDPYNEQAVHNLRLLKHREAKAFAVMFGDVFQIREVCNVNEKEEALLKSPARPIVLVEKKVENLQDKVLAKNVCLSSPNVGAMLPCNPIQILLINECGPLVMTSANASGDVLEIDDGAMSAWMKKRFESSDLFGVKYGIISHNRRILRPLDDSVMKVVAGRQQFIRRGRGFVPEPIPVDISEEIFAAGGDLKSTFCYVKNGLAYVSQHLGDLESMSCQSFYKKELEAMARIFGFEPEKIVLDKHPGYYSKKIAVDNYPGYHSKKIAMDNHPGYYSSKSITDNIEKNYASVLEVQHHKAHVAAVIAEHGIEGDVLGFAFDGTGFGDDGTIWGSETFIWKNEKMERVASLKPVTLIGGDEGAKNCQTILNGFLNEAIKYSGAQENGQNKNNSQYVSDDFSQWINPLVIKAIDSGINTVTSTSMGRLFDAISCMLDICDYNSYEGQAPIELENVAARAKIGYPLEIGEDGSTAQMFIEIQKAIENKVSKEELARGFIDSVANYIVVQCDKHQISNIVLNGGTFLNRILLEKTVKDLEERGFRVYTAEALPPGDGGICLGQAYLRSKLCV